VPNEGAIACLLDADIAPSNTWAISDGQILLVMNKTN
jgi:hypothetical protein